MKHLISLGSAVEYLASTVLFNLVQGEPFSIDYGSDGTMRPFLSITWSRRRYVFSDFNAEHFFEQLEVLENEMSSYAVEHYRQILHAPEPAEVNNINKK